MKTLTVVQVRASEESLESMQDMPLRWVDVTRTERLKARDLMRLLVVAAEPSVR
jgi:hypothetical protein